MLETHAIVVKLDGTEAIVESTESGGCGQCSNINGCGNGELSKMFCAGPREFRVPNGIGAQVGDEVEVSVADGALLRSAFIAYIFPLLLMFAGGSLGTILAGAHTQDKYAAIGALAGLLAGFVLIRWFTLRQRISILSLSPVIASCRSKPVNTDFKVTSRQI
ncbi:MAG: SoxR reducing system RseC family protein [Gallionellaceae bacterium]